MYRPSGKAETKTIRMDSEILRYIHEDAQMKNISDNSLIQSILLRYVISDRYIEDYPIIVVVQDMITSFLENIPSEEVREIGQRIGLNTPRSIFLMKGIVDPTLESVLWYIENNHDKYARWFKFNHHRIGKLNLLHMRHNLGEKWSYFLSGYMKGFFKSILDVEVEVDETESYITVTV